MSLVITTFVPEGIVMAADSRQSITIGGTTPDGRQLPSIETTNSDSVTKLLLLERFGLGSTTPLFQVGVGTFGQDQLGGISVASRVARFSEEKLIDEDTVETIARKLLEFFRAQFASADTGFIVAGYTKSAERQASEPHVYYLHIGQNKLERRNKKADGSIDFGATWSGQIDVLAGLIQPTMIQNPDGSVVQMPKPPIVWPGMALQDAIDFSIYGIRTTIDTIRFQARSKNVGGPIDVLVLAPDGGKWIQKKELHGEQ